MMMQRVIVSKHQKTSMYLGQWNRNNVPVGNYFGLDCMDFLLCNKSQLTRVRYVSRSILMLVGISIRTFFSL